MVNVILFKYIKIALQEQKMLLNISVQNNEWPYYFLTTEHNQFL